MAGIWPSTPLRPLGKLTFQYLAVKLLKMRELSQVRQETNRADPIEEACVRAEAMLHFFYPAELLAPSLSYFEEQKKAKAIQLKDGTRIVGIERVSDIIFSVWGQANELMMFSLDSYGTLSLRLREGDNYIPDLPAKISKISSAPSEIRRKFKALAPDVVNWLGLSIFKDELQPIPEEIISSLKQVASALE
ncbi:hypothetical protein A2V56_02110 [Candidatus Woesebacteria bacterium RBG_19FT_COMBO_42_9]|uniref:Uncharacterized protein n=1 Tax=Candidatus Woesebacteria bacterium RBG_16_42_24 TaxID=1802485 RepID=A0A1F7XKV6_9BACT|nr:MAG: hypothetical protein A2V97_02770 [Candidatus Woesebacteria bacterium RBG_16_42_24]OGM16473.1 MAG: hypothetical protein A2V56_02110 [Candidatus Woesebacteria bacterium RBG_19FT_COMBO_42_9]OGM66229.1 MAG: hypothetical protein A2985_00115 [Candidatus Woesebacteria bacterium RIFCSPLOWO2_01_FULL_43_11]